jgi:rhodanese-related sulfurtransferase
MGLFDIFSRGANSDEITHEDLVAALAAGQIALIDVREPSEYAAGHVAGAVNLPLSRFDPVKLPQSLPVVLMCKAGGRSAQALAKAHAAGRQDVRHYRGGAMGWMEKGGKLA